MSKTNSKKSLVCTYNPRGVIHVIHLVESSGKWKERKRKEKENTENAYFCPGRKFKICFAAAHHALFDYFFRNGEHDL